MPLVPLWPVVSCFFRHCKLAVGFSGFGLIKSILPRLVLSCFAACASCFIPGPARSPSIPAGCTSTLLTDRDCAMAQGKLPWNTWPFPLPALLPALDLQDKLGLSAKMWKFFAPFCGMRESWAGIQVPCSSHRGFSSCSHFAGAPLMHQTAFIGYAKGIFLEMQGAEGLGGHQGTAGCCLLQHWLQPPS